MKMKLKNMYTDKLRQKLPHIDHFTLGRGYTYTSDYAIAWVFCVGQKDLRTVKQAAVLLGFLSCAECLQVAAWLDTPSVL